ncbi:MAG: NAD(P)-dependent oxidoreductase [Gammaproteobacteria bacterium]|nr:NAD(P)-dependent oxidoreductase [Gammaproteobacteria bacterium]MDH3535460.1 NAD(P)-dependent oxidoreductase [Gammaproteobacteria bacterium]
MQLEQIITGAAGFVGEHLCSRIAKTSALSKTAALDLLPLTQGNLASSQTDIRLASMLSELTEKWSAPVLIHLAALAEVIMPFSSMADLNNTNVQGTINLLQAFDPNRFVFASSSAVYGSVHNRSACPLASEAAAIGTYGASKVMGEIICTEWAAERLANAVILRFGNIVGPGCRGLIPYIVSHALRYPDGEVPAQLRGQGRIIRDYIPVEVAVESLLKAASLPLQPGQSAIFNVGSGFGLSNKEVAEVVADVLRRQGYQLELNFDNPIPAGESEAVVLEISETSERLGVHPPSTDAVMQSIEQATHWHIHHSHE